MQFENNSIEKLQKTIKIFSQHNFFTMYESIWSIIFFSLIRGLASGLGWVIGATLLVSILTFFLSQIEFIPIIGDWVSRLIEQIQKFDRY